VCALDWVPLVKVADRPCARLHRSA
jgi:hypothetical protein